MPALLSADAMPDEEHNCDEVLRNAEGGEENYDAFETPAAETYAHLSKPIRDNIHSCIQAMAISHSEWKDAINAINTAFEAQRTSLDEQYIRAKAQEATFEKREALYIRLPTNHVVNLVHNALLTEHAHERVLIADTFRAVKMGKVDMRAARADGLKKAKEVYLRQCKTLSKLIEGLSDMAGKMENERVVGERRLRPTGPALAVRSPAPASYSQTTAHARTIAPLPPVSLDIMTTESLLRSLSGMNSELRHSPRASIAASAAMNISVGQQRQLRVIIKAAIRSCDTEKTLNLVRFEEEKAKALSYWDKQTGYRDISLALHSGRQRLLNNRADLLGSLATVLPAAAIYSDLFWGVTAERQHNLIYDEFLGSKLLLDKACLTKHATMSGPDLPRSHMIVGMNGCVNRTLPFIASHRSWESLWRTRMDELVQYTVYSTRYRRT